MLGLKRRGLSHGWLRRDTIGSVGYIPGDVKDGFLLGWAYCVRAKEDNLRFLTMSTWTYETMFAVTHIEHDRMYGVF